MSGGNFPIGSNGEGSHLNRAYDRGDDIPSLMTTSRLSSQTQQANSQKLSHFVECAPVFFLFSIEGAQDVP